MELLTVRLIEATKLGDLDTVKKLLLQCNEDRKIHSYNLVLNEATRNGHYNIVCEMVEFGATDLLNAFYVAVDENHLAIVEYLGRYLTRTELNDALATASCYNNTKTIELLVSLGAQSLTNALLTAVVYNRIEAAQLLIDLGACNFDAAFQMAVFCNNERLTKLFINMGANVNNYITYDASMDLIVKQSMEKRKL